VSEVFTGPTLAFSRNSKFAFESFSEIAPSTRPMRIKNAWPMAGVAWIVGASGAAKTFVALDATLKLAAGAPTVWGRKAQQCGVIYVAAEDPDGCRARVRAWRVSKARDRSSPMPFRLVAQVVNLLDPTDVDDFTASVILQREEMIAEGHELGVICFDTFSCSIPGTDENSSADMSRATEALKALSAELGCLVVVVAHFGKSGATGGIRGWSGLGYNADGIIVLELDEDNPDLRHMRFDKVKNGIAGARLDFALKEVGLEMQDDTGDAMTSCIVEYKQAAPMTRERRKPSPADKPPQRLIMKAFHQLLDVGQTYVVPPVQGVPPNTSGVERLKLRERAYAIGAYDHESNPATAKRTFNRDLGVLLAHNILREEDGIVWKIR
jgi:hypothetical protein